jgi:2-polyprenyl-3-methyl-5-hydroxy-6-metoxy-1,4-benzoquinol methylase
MPDSLVTPPSEAVSDLGAATRLCPVCGGDKQKVGPVYNGWQLQRCGDCCFVYTAIRSIPDDLYAGVYASNPTYRHMMQAAERTAGGEWGFDQLTWFERMALRWLERRARGRRLVDIGCGPGTFLLVARRRGWEVVGIEPTVEPARRAVALGLDVHQGDVSTFGDQRADRFDVAVSFEVLEHVPQPVPILCDIYRVLEPGGHLLVSVPNLDDPYCLKVQIPSAMPPVHINFFNRTSLRSALITAGFEVLRFKTLPIPTSSIRNIHGTRGWWVRLPYLVVSAIIGRADGTTLIALARRPST